MFVLQGLRSPICSLLLAPLQTSVCDRRRVLTTVGDCVACLTPALPRSRRVCGCVYLAPLGSPQHAVRAGFERAKYGPRPEAGCWISTFGKVTASQVLLTTHRKVCYALLTSSTMADADTCVVTDAASHSHTPVEGLEPNTPSPLAEPSSADMSEEGPFEPRITIPATSYPHIIDAIFASAPYASLLRLRTVDKAWKERADALLGRHLVFSTGGGRSAADPMRVEVSSLSTKNGKRVRRLRFRIERSTSLSVRAEAQRWLEREAFPLVLDLDNWGRHSGNSRWWLPAPIREAMEALRPPTVRIYGSSQAGMGLWGARTERSVVSTAIPPWNTHTAVKIVPAPVLPDTRTLVVNLTIHERGRHVPMGELATWDALPDDLEEIVLIVKDAETAKTFVPRTNTGFVPRPTAASLARQKAQQIRRTNEGRGGEGDRATRQEWGVLRPLHSWLVSAWRCGGVKALMRENHCIRITIVGMTEIKANHAGFTNAMSAEEKSKKLLESRDAIAEIWKGVSVSILKASADHRFRRISSQLPSQRGREAAA